MQKKKKAYGAKEFEVAHCARVCWALQSLKKNSCMGVTPNPCTSPPPSSFNRAIQIETSKQCFFFPHKFCQFLKKNKIGIFFFVRQYYPKFQ